VRIVRFEDRFGRHWGRLDGDSVVALEGPPWPVALETKRREPLSRVHLLAPVNPSKIVAVASNYPKHAAEMGKDVPTTPRIFLKPPSAIIGPGVPIQIPPETTRVDPEGELAVVIGARMARVSAADALKGVLGYTVLNDVTCRDFQKADGLFARAKGFDTFCPIGPWIETHLDPSDLALRTIVNDEVRGDGRTSDMYFKVAELLAFVSNVMTLEPGDVLSTGTPPGVAPIVAGDQVAVFIEGIGTLENPVVNREDRAR
jgi:2-keto-4-pentenoate hydratase/2-oxohepta-3-ene-1,7-dioic acid hydratase in catechol pathway